MVEEIRIQLQSHCKFRPYCKVYVLMDMDWCNNQSGGRASGKSPWSWDDVSVYNFLWYTGSRQKRKEFRRKIYEQRQCDGRGEIQTVFEKDSYYRLTILNTTIEISCHQKARCCSGRNPKERKGNLIHYVKVWNGSKSFILFTQPYSIFTMSLFYLH